MEQGLEVKHIPRFPVEEDVIKRLQMPGYIILYSRC